MFIVETIIGLGILSAVVYVAYYTLNKTEHTVLPAVQKAVVNAEKTVSNVVKTVAEKPAKKATTKAKAPKPATAKPTATKPAKEKKPKAAAKA